MPQAALLIVGKLVAAYGVYVDVAVKIGAAIGLSAGASTAIANAAAQLALGAAIGAITRPQLPEPEGGKFNVRQPRPARRFGVGTFRGSGSYMTREANKDVLHQVIALPEGPVGHFGRVWLNDDEVTVVGNVVQGLADDRYHTGLIELRTRLGADTETNYSELTADMGSIWPSNARGDGVPSLWLRCANGGLASFTKRYPGGPPEATIEQFMLAYDWRLDSTAGGSGPQRRNDKTTWGETNNVVVWTVNILWRRYGQDWDRRFAPALDILTAEADICDEAVPLKAGGTTKRYEVGLWFEAVTPVKTFLAAMLAAMDGHFSVRRDGAFIIRAGHYYEPTVIFGSEELIDVSYNPGPTPDAVINKLVGSFTDPNTAYSQVEVEAWEDAASIAKHGERPQDFFPQGVQSQSQLRRLEKAALDRALTADGSFKTPLSARRGLGQRYVGIRCEEEEDLYDAVVEILDARIDLADASITWTYKLANPVRYDWNAATEEGDPPDQQSRPDPAADDAPEITSITPQFESIGSGGDGVLLHIEGTGPDRDDLTWFVRTRITGSTSWAVQEITDTDPAANFEGDSSFVPSVASLDVELGYQTGGGNFTWSATETVDTSTADAPPGLPGGLSAVDNGTTPDGATVSWSNAANVTHARIYHGSTSDSFPGVGSGSDIAAAPGTAQSANYVLSPGSYNVWVVNKNAAGYGDPAGPATVTVTA